MELSLVRKEPDPLRAQPSRPKPCPRPAPPLVSIIIDNFNYAPYLTRCIDSALAQTHRSVEVIVVDDASTDGSQQIIERYRSRVTVVQQPVNRGQGAAFNAGFWASHGEIVMFLDADDWLYPNAAERVAALWRPALSKIHFRLHLVDKHGVRIDTYPAPELRLDRGDVVPLLLEFGRYETVVTSGNAFSRRALERNLPIPAEEFRIAADGYLASVVPFHGTIECIDACLGAYRVHGTNAYAVEKRPRGMEDLSVRVRRFLEHDAHKLSVLRNKASSVGLRLDEEAQLRDPNHVELRLASLRLDPHAHPYAADSRLSLAVRGVAASRRARLPWPRRAMIAVWFLIVGLGPRRLALPALRWKMQPSSRPEWIDRQVKLARRMLS